MGQLFTAQAQGKRPAFQINVYLKIIGKARQSMLINDAKATRPGLAVLLYTLRKPTCESVYRLARLTALTNEVADTAVIDWTLSEPQTACSQ